MKTDLTRSLLFLAATMPLVCYIGQASAATITQWTFENDAIAVNNSPAPSTGVGTASSIGMNVYPTPGVGTTTDDVLAGVSGDTGTNGESNLTHIWRVRATGAGNGWSSAAP